MNYWKAYNSLIEKARNREKLEGYYEKHHIYPRCLGGTDDFDNIVSLTAREHFIAHLLLAKIYGGIIIHAAHMMSNMKRYNSKDYKQLKIKHAERMKHNLTNVPKLMTEARKQAYKDPERREKISKALKGRKLSKEHVHNWKEARLRNGSFVKTDEAKRKTSESLQGGKNPMYGKTHDNETRRKISEANKRKVKCPHCPKEGGIAIMKRWHFDRCKHKPKER